MKKTYTFAFLMLTIVGMAQAPAGYYSSATSTGYTLKTQLYNIIKNHTDQGYNGLYTTYQTSDRDFYYENDGTVLDMYSENPTGTDPYNFTPGNNQCGNYTSEGDCYNREHIIPQSIFNEEAPMKSDAHFITPTDGKVNGERSNYPHGNVGTASITSQNGSKLGQASNTGYASGYTGIVFEPIDEFKGDIARMYFYFATRYENVITTWGVSYAMFNGTSNQVFTNTFKNILLMWNQMDPVSSREIARNNAIYARQGNRNPYIDNNSYVSAIWGSLLADKSFESRLQISVYPNPAHGSKINIKSETVLDEVVLVNINGQVVKQFTMPQLENSIFSVDNIPQGFYFLKLSAGNQSIIKKVVVE
ncbi:ribonuclease [Flavobacterium noncentrifugens]|uniref:Por secretion system C-terminal sorting domain-containing protein n=1 Tax=Flavobacterium noncentrifugens TaxID=1128970 RepID=A0A1G8ZKI5_9FLAO|nr:endonuclease [Flavobacterium noncentrifugens]GEP52647.1 ribonuclease [Flavobacterium noncentrifugens]SDK15586.1 Por secretion system C-terminal sorting domain-containing protein [Flavobacterium noncentrifugens]